MHCFDTSMIEIYEIVAQNIFTIYLLYIYYIIWYIIFCSPLNSHFFACVESR